MTIEMVLPILMFAFLLFFVLQGYPVAFVLGGLAVIFGFTGLGVKAFDISVFRMFSVMTNPILVAVPMFVYMAVMLERSGIAEDMFHTMYVWMGRLRGGLAAGICGINTLIAATTGISGTGVITMGMLGIPAMSKRGYDEGLAAGTILASGTLGILIPPSIMLVIMGDMMGLSVGELFIAAIFPGLVLSGLYITYILVRSFLQPHIAPAMPKEERTLVPLRHKLQLIVTALTPPIFLIFAVLGTIFFGIATPTEAAGFGAFGAMLIALAKRRLKLATIKHCAIETLRITSMIYLIVLGATAFAGIFLGLGGGKLGQQFLLSVPGGRWGVLAMMMLLVFILGMFLDWLGILFILIPIYMPVAATLGFPMLWFAMLVAVNFQNSFLTPPFGPALFWLKGVAPDLETSTIYRGVVPFIALQIIGLVLIILFPQIVLWLPSLMFR